MSYTTCTIPLIIDYPQAMISERVPLTITRRDGYIDAAVYRAVCHSRNLRPAESEGFTVATRSGREVTTSTNHIRYPTYTDDPYVVVVTDDAYSCPHRKARSLHELVRFYTNNALDAVLMAIFVISALVFIGLVIGVDRYTGLTATFFFGSLATMCASVITMYKLCGSRSSGVKNAIAQEHDELLETRLFKWDEVTDLYRWMTKGATGTGDAASWGNCVATRKGLVYYGPDNNWWSSNILRVLRGY